MKKIIFSIFICTLLSCQENRPHGNQYMLPELTPNNLLMGNLNENRVRALIDKTENYGTNESN